MSTSTFGSAPNQFKIELASYSINGASVINTYSGLNTMYTIQVGDQNTPLLNYSESGVRYNFLITPKTVIDYANVDSSGSLINNIALGTVVTSGVTNLIAIPDTVGSQVTLEWTYGNPNLSYDIIVTVDGYEYNPWPLVPGFSYSIATTNLTQDAFGKTQYVINNLRNGQIYYFRVSPLVKIQVGSIVQQFNAPYSNRAMMAPATFPNIPESVTGFGYNGSVTLNWNQPSIDPNGFYNSFNTIKLYYPIIDYEVLYRNVTLDGSWNVYSFSASPSTTRTLTNLTNECTYNFQIATVISTCKSIHTNSVPLYSGSSSTTMQITNVVGFPILNSYSNWEIIINFTPTGGSGWRGLIGNMYDGVQPGGRGWGLWLNPSNVLHWSFASTSYNLTGLGTLVLNRQCRLTLSKTQYELLFTLRSGYNDASGNYIPIFTQHSLSPAGQTMGTGVVSIGGIWPTYSAEAWVGSISSVVVSNPFYVRASIYPLPPSSMRDLYATPVLISNTNPRSYIAMNWYLPSYNGNASLYKYTFEYSINGSSWTDIFVGGFALLADNDLFGETTPNKYFTYNLTMRPNYVIVSSDILFIRVTGVGYIDRNTTSPNIYYVPITNTLSFRLNY